MAEYKLTKDFPMCPLEVGAIVTEDKWGQYVSEGVIIFEKEIIENYPEFWKKVEELEYEILTVIGKLGNITHKENYSFPECFQTLVDTKESFNIHSVKRLSDSEVFTIGDVLEFKSFGKHKLTIDKFEIRNPTIMFMGNDSATTICGAKKLKTPLFTTIDGVEILKGDTFFVVNTQYNRYKIQETVGGHFSKDNPNLKRFKQKKNAKTYILYNKPCLNFNDIIKDVLDPNSLKAIKETIKNKLQL